MGILNYVLGALAVVVLILSVLLYAEHEKVVAAKAQAAEYQAANEADAAAIDAANASLAKILADNARLSKNAKAAVAKAQKSVQDNQALSSAIQKMQAAPDDCKAATDLLNEYLQKETQ